MVAGLPKLKILELIAYTYRMAYDMGVQDVRIQPYAPGDGERGHGRQLLGGDMGAPAHPVVSALSGGAPPTE